MNNLNISQLKEGITFTKPLLTENGEEVLPANTPLQLDDIQRFIRMKKFQFLTFGDILYKDDVILPGKNDEIRLAKEKLQSDASALRTRQSQVDQAVALDDNQVKREIEQMRRIESRLEKLEILEQLNDSFSTVLSLFIKDTKKSDLFKEKIKQIVEILKKEVKGDPTSYVDLIFSVEWGSHFISHAIKVTILTLFFMSESDTSPRYFMNVGIGAMIHDIGKLTFHWINNLENINIPKDKINLPISHPVYGYKTAHSILQLPDESAQVILNHHEQPDGNGFPRGLHSLKLSKADQILFLSNTIENLCSRNDYPGYQIIINQISQIHKQYPNKFDGYLIDHLYKLMV